MIPALLKKMKGKSNAIYWISIKKNLVIQKEFFLLSLSSGCGSEFINPDCTSNQEVSQDKRLSL